MDKVQIYSVTKVADAKSKYRIKWKVNARHHTRAFPTKARAENYKKELDKANDAGIKFSPDSGEPEDWGRGRKTFAKLVQEYSEANWSNWGQRHKKDIQSNLGLAMYQFLTSSGQSRYSRKQTKDFVKKYLIQKEIPTNLTNQEKDDLERFMKSTYPVGDLTPSLLKKIINRLGKGETNQNISLSLTTQKNRKQAISAVLEYGFMNGDIPKNPFKQVKLKKSSAKSVNPREVLTPEQCRELQTELSGLKDLGPQISKLAGVLWLAGLRPSEAVALQKKHFHISKVNAYLEVAQASVTVGIELGDEITVGGKKVQTSTTLKQLKSRDEGQMRTVPINKELKAQIVPYLKQFKDEDYVFPLWIFSQVWVLDDKGKKVQKKNGTGYLWTIQKTIDKSRPMLTDTIHSYMNKTSYSPIKPYSLRHTNASILIYSGLNIVEIATRLGHSVQVCQNVYVHLLNIKNPFDTSREDGFLKL
jgi:integrase